jgi:hypothetical protein
LVTGPILSLGTPWGLFRHYWILAKLLITLFSTLILLIHIQPIRYLAEAAAKGSLSSTDSQIQIQMVVASAAALLALITTNFLAVYKPKGMTRYGWRKQYAERTVSHT